MRAWRRTAVLGAVVGLVLGAAGAAEEAGLVLLDAPRGAWLGDLRQDAPVQVIEERDGWKRVRIEGWVRAGAPLPPGPAGAAGPAASSPAPLLSGVLTPRPGMQPETVGGGLAVLVLADPAGTDAAHRALGEPCRAALADLDRSVAAAQADVQASLNSSANFKEASQRNDRAKAALQAAQKDRADRLDLCRRQAEAFFSERAAARTVSDAAGRFEIGGLPPGRYRVVAMERTAAAARGWSMTAEVGTAPAAPLEGRAADGPDPYWGLR